MLVGHVQDLWTYIDHSFMDVGHEEMMSSTGHRIVVLYLLWQRLNHKCEKYIRCTPILYILLDSIGVDFVYF